MTVNGTPSYHTQKSVLAYRDHEAVGKCGPRSATKRKPKMVDDCLQPLSAPAISCQDAGIELLTENTSSAHNCFTPEAARQDHEDDAAPSKREVQRPTNITALNPLTWMPAIWTNT